MTFYERLLYEAQLERDWSWAVVSCDPQYWENGWMRPRRSAESILMEASRDV